MEWFEARDLARRRVAIRRPSWTYWLIYRAKVWMIIDAVKGVETRRVVRATDFRDSEFLAKDWTTDTWEGGSYPPCTLKVDQVSTPLVLTSRRWTLSDFCGGDGAGGNVVPVADYPDGVAGEVLELVAFCAVYGSSPIAPTEPDGGGGTCWITPPPQSYVWIVARPGPGMPVGDRAGGVFMFQTSTSGADLSGEYEWNTPLADRIIFGTQGLGPGDASSLYDSSWDGAAWPNSSTAGSANLDPIPIVPGATITVRVDYLATSGQLYTAVGEITHAALCS